MNVFVLIAVSIFFVFLVVSFFVAGPRVMLRWPLMLFKRKPKYAVVKYRGGYFPIKRDPFAYRTMYKKGIGWKKEDHPQSVSMKYSILHAESSFDAAKRKIEELEGEEIEQVSSNGYAGTFWRGSPTFFERKSYESTIQQIFKQNSKAVTIDEMIDSKFSNEEIRETKVGAEQMKSSLDKRRKNVSNSYYQV